MPLPEKPHSSFPHEEKYREKREMIEDIIEALKSSRVALTMEELKEKIDYRFISDYAIEHAIGRSEGIKSKNVGQVMKEFNMKKYSYGVTSKMRIFYLNEEQVENFAKKSPYYS